MRLDQLPNYTEIQALEALEPNSDDAGWAAEYRQLESGTLVATTISADLGPGSLICESVSVGIELCAETPEDFVTLGYVLSDTPISVCGREAGPHDVFTLLPDIELECAAGPGSAALTVHIPLSLAFAYEELFATERGVQVFSATADALAFRDTFLAYAASPGAGQADMSELLSNALAAARRSLSDFAFTNSA